MSLPLLGLPAALQFQLTINLVAVATAVTGAVVAAESPLTAVQARRPAACWWRRSGLARRPPPLLGCLLAAAHIPGCLPRRLPIFPFRPSPHPCFLPALCSSFLPPPRRCCGPT